MQGGYFHNPSNYPPPKAPQEPYSNHQYMYRHQQMPQNNNYNNYPTGARYAAPVVREQPPPPLSSRDFRNQITDKSGYVELKSNVIIFTNIPPDQQQQKDFLSNYIPKYICESYLPAYKIEVVYIADRKTAEGIMVHFKKGFEGKDNREAYWGMEYWMKQSIFDNENGICKIPVKHIPPTVHVKSDGSYEYIYSREQRRLDDRRDRRDDYHY
ncbi:hypothetical protein EHI8A_028720 [Entamoeba histolytica HM-1:IMSS-B]|uniref:Uncharacterized protein n=7 Tax=Entamoeba TaxID=5758 RepID=C4M106_ENTH1|nr:hypothetical protein EHI_135200 [Entamoeba histolytica HM-1:IMSS]EMD44953.1 Hypothetical protein EHI5A_055360 [Entamoeba histolytica KU27]EMH72402.1 hypothetical protein EHI8A_028720 [Entamoeba histolytica HM-1:IMSS-B]EMS14987.1 hypothetical protein KM1_066500 [Entamoeba histolytica HM-3:IMSS]ENY63075.1 hypothetical protein EHI7A_030800 [Entamoeba histolytica HM-1:IMSS-A]GAT94866.1 hypothetical protein CL6EHI_135200 [Entamoeba histolytica]|eukprot:XP_649748.1 hypothetical protein EHI_135200 [Entamoeba histolytica HM-1:IMSS]